MQSIPESIPCLIDNSAKMRLGQEFMVRAVCMADHTGGVQTLVSKRAINRTGDQPGVVLRLVGTKVEFKTRGQHDLGWTVCSTARRTIQAGQRYDIIGLRKEDRGWIYINGIDHTYAGMGVAAAGDLNNDVPIAVGCQLYDGKPFYQLMGEINLVGFYGYIKKPPKVRFPNNPNVVPIQLAGGLQL